MMTKTTWLLLLQMIMTMTIMSRSSSKIRRSNNGRIDIMKSDVMIIEIERTTVMILMTTMTKRCLHIAPFLPYLNLQWWILWGWRGARDGGSGTGSGGS